MNSEILLVFPPTTEARLFPYLSLPMITAYLRKHGANIDPFDLNIRLCHQLFTKAALTQYLKRLQTEIYTDLKHRYRLEMVQYLLAHQEELYQQVFRKKQASEERMQRAVRFVRQGIELLLEGSILKKEVTSLDQMIRLVEYFELEETNDFPAQIQYQMLLELLNKRKPSIFAVSIAYYSQLLPSLLLAKWVKQHSPDLLVVFGGQQMMLRHPDLMKHRAVKDWVDAIGIGAGEETMLKLWQYQQGLVRQEEIPDLLWTQKPLSQDLVKRSALHIKNVPPPDFSDLPIHHYLNEEVHLSLITCVGCYWGRCIFCSYGNRSYKQKSYQQKTASQIARECKFLVETYGIHRINFVDENTNLRLVLHAMRILNDQGIQIQFSTRNRLEDILLDLDFCMELKKRGCVLMSVGYETNSQRLLDRLDKGVKASNYQQIIDNLHQVKIPLRLSLMGGILDETEEEFQESLQFLLRNADKIGIDVMQMLVAEPTTYLAENPERYGIRIVSNTKLRGNRLLNYGMGRMGYDFHYPDGDTFLARLEQFLSIFRHVQPQKNDELPPDARWEKENEQELSRIEEIQLYPWVKVIQASVGERKEERRFIVDMLWQRFFHFPEKVIKQEGNLLRVRSSHLSEGSYLLKSFLHRGIGTRT
jgi:anaerobic magnesium-protoporphyrin IX monomethyl ester cyclase